jgi:hypothetical protein
MSNDTCDLVSRPHGINVVTDKWIFKHKFNANGALERYKVHCFFTVSCSVPVSIMMRLLALL